MGRDRSVLRSARKCAFSNAFYELSPSSLPGGSYPWINFEQHYETEALLLEGDEALARGDVQRTGERLGQNRRKRLAYLRMLAVLAR